MVLPGRVELAQEPGCAPCRASPAGSGASKAFHRICRACVLGHAGQRRLGDVQAAARFAPTRPTPWRPPAPTPSVPLKASSSLLVDLFLARLGKRSAAHFQQLLVQPGARLRAEVLLGQRRAGLGKAADASSGTALRGRSAGPPGACCRSAMNRAMATFTGNSISFWRYSSITLRVQQRLDLVARSCPPARPASA